MNTLRINFKPARQPMRLKFIGSLGSGTVRSVNGNPGPVVVLTKANIGLGNVDNTSDVNKPISTATQTAINLKADAIALTTHTSNTNNPHATTKAQVGLSNVDNTSDANKPLSGATQTALSLKEDVVNKSTNVSLGTSDTLYPTQKAVKQYVDTAVAGASSSDDGLIYAIALG